MARRVLEFMARLNAGQLDHFGYDPQNPPNEEVGLDMDLDAEFHHLPDMDP